MRRRCRFATREMAAALVAMASVGATEMVVLPSSALPLCLRTYVCTHVHVYVCLCLYMFACARVCLPLLLLLLDQAATRKKKIELKITCKAFCFLDVFMFNNNNVQAQQQQWWKKALLRKLLLAGQKLVTCMRAQPNRPPS